MELETPKELPMPWAKPVQRLKGTGYTVKCWWAIVLSLLMHRLPFVFSSPSSLIDLKRVCIILSYLLLLFALLRNLHIWAARIAILGTLMNFLAIVANRGFMPVSLGARLMAGKTIQALPSGGTVFTGSGGIVLPLSQTKLWILTDIIPVSSIRTVFSIGDMIMVVGILIAGVNLVFWAVKGLRAQAEVTSAEQEKLGT